MTGVVAPDPIPLLRAVLLADDAVVDLLGGEPEDRIRFEDLTSPTFPFLRLWVAPGGGVVVEDRVTRTVVDVHSYSQLGAPAADQSLLARTVHAALLGARLTTDDAVLLHVTEIVAPFPLPDDSGVDRDEPLPRWVATVAAHVRPNP